jgi:hypothetical protein
MAPNTHLIDAAARCECGLLATHYKRDRANVRHACPKHTGLGWKRLEDPTYEIECSTADLQRLLAS